MSVILSDVSKEYETASGPTRILDRVNFRLNSGEHVGILGQNGSGKSTMIRVLSGIEKPSAGQVRREMSVSWPLAFGGAFLGQLTGIDNIRFICRLYGVDWRGVLPFVEDFAELGKYLNEPVRSYSSGMRARLAFATSMAIDFDCYLIDEIVAVGDDRFARKCEEELFGRRGDRAMLIVSHSPSYIRAHCQRASVLSAGRLSNFDNVDDAFEFYSTHELRVQPHMAAMTKPSAKEALPPFDFNDALLDQITTEWEARDADGFDAYLRALDFDRALTFDACDAVGRIDRRGFPQAAIDVASFLSRRYPREALYFVTLGDHLTKARQHRPGVDAYRSALSIDPDNYWANRNLATEFYNTGFYDEAIPYFRKAATLCDPETAVPLEMRVVDCLTWLDRQDDSSPASAKILATQPLVVDSATYDALSDGRTARLAISGLVRGHIALDALAAVVRADDQRLAMHPVLPSGSLRRFAAASGCKAFAFHLYGPVAGDLAKVAISVQIGGLELAVEEIDVRRVDWESVDDDLLAEARRADKAHQTEASSMLYGTLADRGDEYDVVLAAEKLIDLGFYHEAEFRLARSQPAVAGEANEQAAAVLDLICVEVARSRVPGWQDQIEGILARQTQLENFPSLEANRGHALVAAGDPDAAIAHYDVAAERAGRQTSLIHFARGVHSARFANDVEWRELDPLAKVDGAVEDARIVHLFACDGIYFERYGEAIVKSSFAAMRDQPGVVVHAHVVDATAQAREVLEKLAEQFPLQVTTEQSPSSIEDAATRRAYYTCARYLAAPALLERYRCPILITETDALVNWRWEDIIDYVEEREPDVGHVHSALWNWVPWVKIPAGIFLYAPTRIGREWADFVARYIAYVFDRQGGSGIDVWTVDQVALWLAYVKAPAERQDMHLPMHSVLTLATGDKSNVLAA